jgi:signal transduction histidine kinase
MENKTSVIFIVIAGTVAMIGLVAAILLFVIAYRRRLREKEDEHRMQLMEKEREMLLSVITAQEAEREKIARNIHDEIGPLAGLLKMNLSTKSATQKVNLTSEMEVADLLMENLRTASHDLVPSVLRKNGLGESLRFYTANLKQCRVDFQCDLRSEHPFQRSDRALNVYRIALEALKNVMEYDRPDFLKVHLFERRDQIHLLIEHNGKGLSNSEFNALAGKNGLGLESIQARTLLLKGLIDYQKGSPATVQLSIPAHE